MTAYRVFADANPKRINDQIRKLEQRWVDYDITAICATSYEDHDYLYVVFKINHQPPDQPSFEELF